MSSQRCTFPGNSMGFPNALRMETHPGFPYVAWRWAHHPSPQWCSRPGFFQTNKQTSETRNKWNKQKLRQTMLYSSWWFIQPLWKIWVNMGIISPNRGENNKIFELPPPSNAIYWNWAFRATDPTVAPSSSQVESRSFSTDRPSVPRLVAGNCHGITWNHITSIAL